MPSLTLVTGNAHKLNEYRRIMTAEIKLQSAAIELVEIQSFNSQEIVEDKAQRAYEQLASPVIVEDVSAGLASLNGLPGPFIKFFEQQLGKEALYTLARPNDIATITCTIGFYDGVRLFTVQGVVEGTVGPARGNEGFGFDFVFVPHGQTQTFAEMGARAKDSLSHRARAVAEFLKEYGKIRV